jgi:hypothetical protein
LVKASLTKKRDLWENAEMFLEVATEAANEDVLKVDRPVRKIEEEVLHYDINDTTESQAALL